MFNRRLVGALGIAAALALGVVTPASADNNGNNNNNNRNRQVSAPEIDASSGIAAIVLLLGVLGLISERRRRPPAAA